MCIVTKQLKLRSHSFAQCVNFLRDMCEEGIPGNFLDDDDAYIAVGWATLLELKWQWHLAVGSGHYGSVCTFSLLSKNQFF